MNMLSVSYKAAFDFNKRQKGNNLVQQPQFDRNPTTADTPPSSRQAIKIIDG